MKLLKFLPVAILVATVFVSCDNDKNEKEHVTEVKTEKRAREGKRTDVTVDKLPASVVTTFETKAAKAEDVKWVAYEPVEADKWELGKDYYFVTYRFNNVPYEAWYSYNGDLINEEPVISLPNSGNMPKAIVKSIMELYPGYEIEEVDKENDKDMDMYEVELKKGDKKAKVKFLLDGTVFKAK